jgi:uncharacterized protein YidB (DUF937 family)
MGLLDDVLGSAVPGGNLAKPIAVAAAALLAGRAMGAFGGGSAAASPPPTAAPPATSGQPQGGLLGSLSGLIQSFQQSGHGDTINSWIGPGQNQPITPDQLHQALGPQAVDNLSRLTGVPAPELMSELSRVLPGIIDRLTPQGRMPDAAELSRW